MECQNGCNRFKQSVDEIYEAGLKHRKCLIEVKEVADNQKMKIVELRKEKNELQEVINEQEISAQEGHELYLKVLQENNSLRVMLKDMKDESEESQTHFNKEYIEECENKVKELSTNNSDLKDEICMKEIEIMRMSAVIEERDDRFIKEKGALSLSDEMNQQSDTKSKYQVEKRTEFLKKMENLSIQNLNQISTIKEKIKLLEKNSPSKCWYGIECRRIFCKFNHNHVFKLDNRRQRIIAEVPQGF